jgi:glutathione S-transferase
MPQLLLFSLPDSGHAHRVELILSMLELDYELRDVNLNERQHRTEEFRAMNPWAQVPVLVDGPIIIRESNAILVYLARRQRALTWLPADPAQSAYVETWLAKAAGELAFGIAAARLILRFGRIGNLDAAQKLGRKLLAVTDSALSGISF